MGLRRRLRGLILRVALLAGSAAGALTCIRHSQALLPGDGALLVLGGALSALVEAVIALLLVAGLAALWTRWRRRLTHADEVWASSWAWDGLLLALVGGLVIVAEHRPDRDGRSKPRDSAVWLVTLDTLRADHVSAIGGGRRDVPTPNLDALAERCTLFSRGVSPEPLEVVTDLELLATAGSTGLSRGFEHYDDAFGTAGLLSLLPQLGQVLRALDLVPHQRTADQTLARLRRWLRTDDQREEFIWVHLYDPHAPYEAPDGWRGVTPWDTPDAPGNLSEMHQARAEIRQRRELFMPLVPLDLRRVVAAYADEVRWTDAALGEILALVRPTDTLIVAADHGESLTEHGALLTHGSQVYETTTRVPIIACLNRPDAPRRVDEPVPLQAIGITLKATLDLREPEPGGLEDYLSPSGDRPPLLSFAGEMQSRDQPMIRHGWELALREGEVKWVSGRDGVLRRFLPVTDPGELEDTAPGQEQAVRAAIEEEFAKTRLRLTEIQASSAADADQSDALRALGYVE